MNATAKEISDNFLIDSLIAENIELKARIAELEAKLSHVETLMTVEVNGREYAVPADVALRMRESEADAARFQWLTEDHADPRVRERVWAACQRLPMMSLSAARMNIDANKGPSNG